MSTYIKTLKQGSDTILPRTKTNAISNQSGDNLDVILRNKADLVNGKVPSGQLPAMDYQPTINVNGILKGDGEGGVSAAVAGTDYLSSLPGRLGIDSASFTDANQCVQNGWYADNTGRATNVPANWGTLFVSNLSWGSALRQDYFVVSSTPANSVNYVRYWHYLGGWSPWEQCNYAPAGYGLGKITPPAAPTVDGITYNADECTKNGWYRAVGNTPNNSWWYIFVCSEGENILTQFAFSIRSASGIADGTIAKRYRSVELGAWSAWEYINPPMVTNVVYRTTERRNGLPVYKKQDSNGVQYWSTDQTNWNAESNVKIETGSYVGTNTYGESNPNTVSLNFDPKFFMVWYDGDLALSYPGGIFNTLITRGRYSGQGVGFLYFSSSSSGGASTYDTYVKIQDNTVYWYNRNAASKQLNQSGITFKWIAIG